MSGDLSSLKVLLEKGKILEAVNVTREWLLTAKPGEPHAFLKAQTDKPLQKKMAMLFSDLLSRYPHTIVGCPVFLYAVPRQTGADEPIAPKFRLPMANSVDCTPCEGFQFLGWLPHTAKPPIALPLEEPVALEWKRVSSLVALFQVTPEFFEVEEVIIPSEWWANLFLHTDGNVYCRSRLALPYPDALDAANLAHAVARFEPQELGPFLHDSALEWAHADSSAFRAECREWLHRTAQADV